MSQVGDLVVSYFKRISKIKDTGKILPGHGGLLDRIDGMILAIPLGVLIWEFQFTNYTNKRVKSLKIQSLVPIYLYSFKPYDIIKDMQNVWLQN